MNIPKLPSSNVAAEMDANAVKLEPNLFWISSQLKQPHSAPDRRSNVHGLKQSSEEYWSSTGHSPLDDGSLLSTPPICAAPICRQFWKAGVYNDEFTPKSSIQSGSSYLHIHPRFLHSNATSHKWVFGAIAELIDNAVDEIQYGATFVIIDKISNPRNGNPALLIQDDGHGMDPEAMRRCLSFGFSDKKSISTIGKYGNGFKTSSMRLGADVIVFSRNTTNRTMTQSIGLLSYTFLTRAGYNRIVVPMVHYEFNFITRSFDSLQSKDNENSNLNLSLLLQWSPYSTEAELLKQFEDVGPHGTKVIVYNLWLGEDGNMELDFESDPEDICISRDAHGKMKDGSRLAVSEQHLASRLRYSLRCPVLTTIGFIKEAPLLNIHGFNVYHKNRLILPFWPVVSFSANRGRGVVGILEANFIEPTHDKQDFEKTSLFQKLVQRLREMTWEYWDFHCGFLGYQFKIKARPPSITLGSSNFIYQHGIEQSVPARKSFSAVGTTRNTPMIITHGIEQSVPARKSVSAVGTTRSTPMITTVSSKAALASNSFAKPVQPSLPTGFQEGSNLKRKSSDQPTTSRLQGQMEVDSNKRSNMSAVTNTQEAIAAMEANRRLRVRCSEFEKAEQQLKLKVTQLKTELGEAQREYALVLEELLYLDKVKWETSVV